MANKPKKEYVTKRNAVPQKAGNLLNVVVSSDAYNTIMSQIKRGSAFVCFGSENAPKEEVLQAIASKMFRPTSNGVALYDSRYVFDKQCNRPVVIIGVNDNGNKLIIDSIRLLKLPKSQTLYSADYREV